MELSVSSQTLLPFQKEIHEQIKKSITFFDPLENK